MLHRVVHDVDRCIFIYTLFDIRNDAFLLPEGDFPIEFFKRVLSAVHKVAGPFPFR